jgi:pyruvate-ferredoxin/flavodoxin oxidoreductase
MVKMQSMDGNTAAAYASYAFTEVAAIYPITPSSPMAEVTDQWAADGKVNIFGKTVEVQELQSEGGASGAVHGSLKAGALTTTYTASQGLLLMIPNMYKIAGELLPTVFQIAARALTTNALNIFGDHGDVMAARQTGFAMLFESSVQEVMDLSIVAHLATLESRVPFMNIFDGFRTSHEVQKIEVVDYDDIKKITPMEAIEEFRAGAMNPEHPTISGTNQNPDVHFQQREAVNAHYERVPAIVKKYMDKINEIRGTNYDLVDFHGAPDAEEVVIVMGSAASTVRQSVDYLNRRGRKVGVLSIHLYRPFPTEEFLAKLPKTVKSVAVLDRTKEPGALGEPLLLDVQSAVYDSDIKPAIIGGRYGLGSKDVLPNQIIAVYDELAKPAAEQKKRFTIGIVDDVTHTSLEVGEVVDPTPEGTIQAKFWGFGSDGTVGANKSSIKIIGENTDKYAQGYFSYDSKKSGGLTISHLRFGDQPIESAYMIDTADFIACHVPAYVKKINVLKGLKKGGTFLLNCPWSPADLETHLPASIKRYIKNNDIKFYIIDAAQVAREVGLGRRINTAMQTAFFKLSGVIDFDKAVELLKESAIKSYARKSMKIVELNHAAIDKSIERLVEIHVPESWATAEDAPEKDNSFVKIAKSTYVSKILDKVNRQEGDELTVGDFVNNGLTTGEMPLGTAAFEKRGVALSVPVWDAEKCIACNECSFVCPHAAIRPFLATDEELENAPDGFITKDVRGIDGLKYRIQVSVEDCTGCGLCVETCPAREKALEMALYETQSAQARNWEFATTISQKKNPKKVDTVQGSQFQKPLLEFSGACEGCGETPYAKLLTQLFGDRMMIANATGCSSIWGAAFPAGPFTTTEKGYGPAWSNSLFEDNAEFGFGMKVGSEARRRHLQEQITEIVERGATEDGSKLSPELAETMQAWLDSWQDSDKVREAADALKEKLEADKAGNAELESLYTNKDLLVKTSQWILGGDGWAYDIGYGGLDHVIASGQNVNLLVMDNEVYANTGGQASKATPEAAIAKFAAAGKRTAKKDLGALAISYGNVYVAQIASGANPQQTIKAFEEAEKFPGTSIVIAYTPCINHGLAGGLRNSLTEAKEAVESGYWSLYRYNPELKEKGKNPMQLDYKKPDFSKTKDFILKQVRFSALSRIDAELAERLYAKTVEDAKERFYKYATLSGEIDKIKAKLEGSAVPKVPTKAKAPAPEPVVEEPKGYKILTKRVLNPTVCLLEIEAPLIAKKGKAGQFIIVRATKDGERIPLTIADSNLETGGVSIILQIVGATTQKLANLNEGDYVADFVGPLGRPSELDGLKKVAVIGGGVGCAIAYPIAKALHKQGTEVHSIIGFRSEDLIILEDEFKAVSDKYVLMTDDGSKGTKGLVTNALEKLVGEGNEYDEVIAIGPLIMMKFVVLTAKKFGLKCTVSMNPIMVDGTGMCGACRLTVGGKTQFACVDGPDFNGYDIDFDEAMERSGIYRPFEEHAAKKECNLHKVAAK